MRSTGSSFFKGEYTRETTAADTFKWLYANKYAGHKIILWGHTVHLGRGTQPGYPTNMGAVFDQTYGEKYYATALTASQGPDLQWWSGAGTTDTYDLPNDRDGSVEAVLSKPGKDYYFVDTARNTSEKSAGLALRLSAEGKRQGLTPIPIRYPLHPVAHIVRSE